MSGSGTFDAPYGRTAGGGGEGGGGGVAGVWASEPSPSAPGASPFVIAQGSHTAIAETRLPGQPRDNLDDDAELPEQLVDQFTLQMGQPVVDDPGLRLG